MLKTYGVSDDVVASLAQIIETVMAFRFDGYKVEYDACVIRGQGYYTGTVVEVFDDDFGRAIGGGGRYDKMIEKFAGISIPAVGASIGLYSVVMLMNERGFKVPTQKLALIYDKNVSYNDVLKAKIMLMEKGYLVSVFAFPKNFNNFADKIKKNGYDRIVKMNDLNKIIEI
jgi:histidyl-tRNA synthetase